MSNPLETMLIYWSFKCVGYIQCLVIYNALVVITDFAKRWKYSVLPVRQCNKGNHGFAVEHIWWLETLLKLRKLNITWNIPYRILYTRVRIFWMFNNDTEVQWPSSELKTAYQQPLQTDYIQATMNKNVSDVESLYIVRAFISLTNTLAIHKRAALSEWEIATSATLF